MESKPGQPESSRFPFVCDPATELAIFAWSALGQDFSASNMLQWQKRLFTQEK
jgi:hypothetical protein